MLTQGESRTISQAPFVDPKVLEWLESRFPDRLPRDPQDHATYLCLTGEQSVIRLLRLTVERQSKNLAAF